MILLASTNYSTADLHISTPASESNILFRRTNIMELQLGDVQQTALIPLAIKANETKGKKRIIDPKAVEIIDALGVDTRSYDKYLSHEGVVSRTIMFDHTVRKLLEKYPDANIINLGCGFDDRFSRVDNGILHWYDVDLPDSITARAKVFPEKDRVTMVAGDALNTGWTDKIDRDKIAIVIAEGFFMYFTKDETRTILNNLTSSFPKGFLLSEMMSKFAAGDQGKHHDTVKATNAKFKWGTDSGEEFVELAPELELIKEDSFNVVMKHFSLRCRLFATILPNINNRLAVFKWQ